MTTEDFIIDLFCCVDDQMLDAKKHSQAGLYPSEVVTLAILFALKGVGNRAFYRWLARDYQHLFPDCPCARGCFGCSIPTGIGRSALWQRFPCWVRSTPVASNYSTHAGKVAASNRSARRGCRIGAGS